MNQEALFYESFNQALTAVVAACGGAKKVGSILFPEKTADAARSQLLDCLNDDRPAKLSPEHIIMVLRMGQEVGCHAAINYISSEAGYSTPQPITPEDEAAKLQREFIQSMKAMQSLTEKMERKGLL
ncbi:hypothetical protein CEQ07_05115 [Oligella urethralis]|uniref:hypothetical protein n=1 Tax=Oligella urethralis TaxID=90245 RepID=UPI000D003BE3|nr:hypothetical protein [Oligella urethralis]AVL70848.1 hypothetical protein CEQ07_05115 [Oligella urethralis]